MSNLTVDLWQTFDFTTLNTTNLAASDNCSVGTWSLSNAAGHLTMTTAAETLLKGTINGSLNDASGTRGLSYQSSVDYEEGFVTYAFSTAKASVSYGFLFRYPAAFLGSFAGGEPDLFYMENSLAQREPYLKLEDDGSANAHLFIFSPEDDQFGPIDVAADTWVWITGLYVAGGTHRCRVYNTTTGAQIGSEITLPGSNSQNCTQVTLGNLIGDPSHINQPFQFDDLVLDWTNHVFPIGPPAADVTLTLDQEGFRWRNDDGSETTATWQAAQDTNVTVVPDQTTRLRMLINTTGDAPSDQYKLQYRKVGDASWRDVDT